MKNNLRHLGEVRQRRGPLTPHEFHALRAAAEGKTAEESARERHIGTETIKTHRKNVLRKLDARNMAQAVARGYDAGILGRARIEDEATGGQKSAFKAKRDELARLRGAEKSQVESEALAAASLRLSRVVSSISDHDRSEASDTLDWLEEEIRAEHDAKAASVIREHRSGE